MCLHNIVCSRWCEITFITQPYIFKKTTESGLHPHGYKHCQIYMFKHFVVYLLKCPCGLLYVGETTQKIKDRISKHKSTIRTGQTALPVPAHFQKSGHTVSQLKYQVIDTVPIPRRGGNRLLALHKLEMQWIHRLDTVWPRGLNKDYTPVMFIYQ
ncbi:hypothetical protein XELAEV_18031436mg [Xenopus laevis]|uniref:GIY-YIG domain-containing protein n=1 Tax=Xenopus laevis TaxID=8355 RepID=A0A974HFS2_XENLA|nr:hypothetical protein XELAEV_18031436mg [Xenopus laevis]